MESRIAKKVDQHLSGFKDQIKEWFNENDSDICGECSKNDFLQFIFDYNSLSLSKDDFSRRKRIKNTVPLGIRCCARRANGEQCTRRRREGEEYCGTHIKGTPYGQVTSSKNDTKNIKKLEVRMQEIVGIQYFIDDDKNVYSHSDILNNKTNPEVIAKYDNVDGEYVINNFKD